MINKDNPFDKSLGLYQIIYWRLRIAN